MLKRCLLIGLAIIIATGAVAFVGCGGKPGVTGISGKYLHEDDPESYLELKSDGTFYANYDVGLLQDGYRYGIRSSVSGTYKVEDDTIILSTALGAVKFWIKDNALWDEQDKKWVKESALPEAREEEKEAGIIQVPDGPKIKVVFTGPSELKVEWEKLGMADFFQVQLIGTLRNISSQTVKFSEIGFLFDGHQVAFIQGRTLQPSEEMKILRGFPGYTENTKVLEVKIKGFEKVGGPTTAPTPAPSSAPIKYADSFDYPVKDDNPNDNLEWNVVQDFGESYAEMGGYHSGEDWNLVGGRPDADLGKPAYAMGNGEVKKVSPLGNGKLGYLVAIEHQAAPGKTFIIPVRYGQSYSYSAEEVTRIVSVYVHLMVDESKIFKGVWIEKGSPIGTIMNPGGGPHLHFEIRHPDAIHSSDWSMVGDKPNWAIVDNKVTGYYFDLQKMVDAGLRHPSDFIKANLGEITAPSASLSLTTGPVGTEITVNGTGFVANAVVTITWDGLQVATATAERDGTFSAEFVAPSSTTGDHIITITDGHNTVQGTFTIEPMVTIDPTAGPVGTEITVSGTGFVANAVVTITWDGLQVATATAERDGTFSAEFVAPSSTTGDHIITITDGHNTVQGTFTIEP